MQINDKANLLIVYRYFHIAITLVRASLVVQCCKTVERNRCVYTALKRERERVGESNRARECVCVSLCSHLQFKRNLGFVPNIVAGFFIIVFGCLGSSRSVEAADARLCRDGVMVDVVCSVTGAPIESSKESLSVSRRSLPSVVPIIPR